MHDYWAWAVPIIAYPVCVIWKRYSQAIASCIEQNVSCKPWIWTVSNHARWPKRGVHPNPLEPPCVRACLLSKIIHFTLSSSTLYLFWSSAFEQMPLWIALWLQMEVIRLATLHSRVWDNSLHTIAPDSFCAHYIGGWVMRLPSAPGAHEPLKAAKEHVTTVPSKYKLYSQATHGHFFGSIVTRVMRSLYCVLS